ncbi:MAG: LysE family translocator [Acidobacteriota bacterium]
MTTYLAAGLVLGLSAGLAPGPLLALVLRQSLQYGRREGILVSASPLITDLPIVAGSVFLAQQALDLDRVFGWVALIGAGYVLYLAVETAKARFPSTQITEQAPRSLLTGVLANVLSPHPYLFWLTVGAPMVVTASREHGIGAAAGFVTVFYVLLVGSKIVLAVLLGGSRQRLSPTTYRTIMTVLGAALAVFAVLLAIDGWRRLGGPA